MLVIEGDDSVAKLFATIFSQRDWEVDAPRDGRGVTKALLSSKRYDMILVSYSFPSTNGVEIIRMIRELEHRRATPVLMVTDGGEVADEAIGAGADGVLHKPIELDGFVATVMNHLASSSCTIARGNVGATTEEGRDYSER